MAATPLSGSTLPASRSLSRFVFCFNLLSRIVHHAQSDPSFHILPCTSCCASEHLLKTRHNPRTDAQYHFRPHHGAKQFDYQQTLETQGIDPDYSKRQMFETIEKGGEYRWTMMVQVMTPEQATKTSFDPFDVTKVWPRGTSIHLSALPIQIRSRLAVSGDILICIMLTHRRVPHARSRRGNPQPQCRRLPP